MQPSGRVMPDVPGRWTAGTVGMGYEILDRMEQAVIRVRGRLLRATKALEDNAIPYAVVGGHAIASWVARVDEGAVRTTRDVDLVVRRADLPLITRAMESAGFVRGEVMDDVMFRDGPEGKPSEAVHLLFEGEKVRPDHNWPTPDIDTVVDPANYRVLKLEQLVSMKLLSHRDKDKTHLRDLIAVGLVDETWLSKYPPDLAARLNAILDTPDG